MAGNATVARSDKFGAAMSAPGGAQIQIVALADSFGNVVRTTDNGDGTSTMSAGASAGGTVEATFPSAAYVAANAGTVFSTTLVSMLAVDITVTSFAGGASPSITFFVDRLGADGVYYRLYTSAAINSASATSVQIGPFPAGTGIVTGLLTQTARFGWTFAGAPTSVTFSASVIGR